MDVVVFVEAYPVLLLEVGVRFELMGEWLHAGLGHEIFQLVGGEV